MTSPSSPGSLTLRGSLLLLLALATACLEPRDEALIGAASTAGACGGNCHGNGKTPAPPIDLDGHTASSFPGVGAHLTHLSASDTHLAIPCESCHVVPTSLEVPGHLDHPRPATVTFGGLALAEGRVPTYDSPLGRCSNTYCHSGAPTWSSWSSTAVWTQPRSSIEACGSSCHGSPPGGKHPSSNACERCHETAGPGQTIANKALHLNGKLEVSASGCNACHGSEKNNAPPRDTEGNSDTTFIGVGAHQSHLGGGKWSREVECVVCHKVPASVDDIGHIDSPLPAEVSFTSTAVAQGATPIWNRVPATCASSYCHGAPSWGGSTRAPIWTQVDSTQATCDGCHSLPPPAPHSPETNCQVCHRETAGPSQTIVSRNKHVDGIVQPVSPTCSTCHGSDANSAPPSDLTSCSSTACLGVGAHQSHLSGGQVSRPVDCSDCHIVPMQLRDPGHIDSKLPAEIVFSSVASAGGVTPAWDRSKATCVAFCHGQSSWGGKLTQPAWTTVDNTQAKCGNCHGVPPPPPHSSNTACFQCHPDIDATGNISNRALHVNGVVNVLGGPCNLCHGDATSAAPPMDQYGLTSTSAIGVGAHRKHTDSSQMKMREAMTCETCHPVPPQSTVHRNRVSDVRFTDISLGSVTSSATTHVCAPVWTRSPTPTCTNVYCHGDWIESRQSGGAQSKPVWTLVDGTQTTCASCHGMPPPPPHLSATKCWLCHGTVVDDQLNIIGKGLHINGMVDF
ncbi:MAG: CxxxxCH/CxxCH domain-containing protein [Myxococcales bacterium]